ncbi:MAG TPA: PHP domain-containing protein, partial [Myxococcales bacterium LLY-WYZ-16_1]|nr:PHP domain-containing protein [Myxococcales bacterium LLY-WYZ-16_1]
MDPGYVELRCASNFSLLRGASHPEELVEAAVRLGHRQMALTDHNGLYGVVRAHRAAKEHGLDLLVGAELRWAGASTEQPGLVVLAADRDGYGRLCTLLSQARTRVGKGGFELGLDDLAGLEGGPKGLWAIHVGRLDDF